ncbi:E3 ubiquitin-protein ligase NRDP1 [Diaporthe helianthi]|uniref:E3 ubiquitin-protein ligase NRDP1 n=1 Tax=Diaporthe helianthi TaxID=158607 RepID=A0A2P5IBU4_DIAHE|nr:E3 ubiquitin-protein ligase NRDP1 [Diaporthe helianthi]
MPPPNTPNEPSGASSPNSTRPARTHAEPSRISARRFPSSNIDLEAIFTGRTSPARSNSGSATPSARVNPLHEFQRRFPELRWPQLENPSDMDFYYDSSWYFSPTYQPPRRHEETIRESSPDQADPTRNPAPYSPQIDWQGLEYTSQVDENLLCGICKTPYYKPLTTKACGHTFCDDCLSRALEESRSQSRRRAPCPLCRTELSVGGERGARRFIRVVDLSAQLDRLNVKCPNNTEFCKWTGPRSNVVAHVNNDCEWTPYSCPDSSCEKTIIRKSRGTTCLHHEGPCTYCQETIDLSTQVRHHMTVCAKCKASCEYCGQEVARDLLEHHMMACAAELATCAHSKMGCSFSSPRKDILDHEKTCGLGHFSKIMQSVESNFETKLADMKEYLTTQMEEKIQLQKRQMDTKLQGIQQEVQEEAKKREQLAERLSKFERVNLRLSRYRGPAASDSTAGEVTDEAGRPSLPLPEGNDFEQAEYIFRMFDDLDTRINNISKTLIDQDARQNLRMMTELMPIKEQLVEARSQVGVMSMHVRWLMDLQRSRQRQATEVGGSVAGGGGGGSSSGSSTGNGNAQSSSGQESSGSSGSSGGSGPLTSPSVGILRRVSDRVSPVRPSL